jgi:hypothetical protein
MNMAQLLTRAVVAAGVVVALSAAHAAVRSESRSSAIVELRQYTLRPGQRDVLIDLFEREFVESQEALGMKILGTFRDLDKPDRFVWLRGFGDMKSRPTALQSFYSGPIWQANRNTANATMVDSDNVLLLHAARPTSAFTPAGRLRPPRGATEIPKSVVVANIYYFDRPVASDFIAYFDNVVSPHLKAAGMTPRATYASETDPNNFPQLPIRDKDHVFAWFATFPDGATYQRGLTELSASAEWQRIAQALRLKLAADPEVLRLQPTARSEMR